LKVLNSRDPKLNDYIADKYYSSQKYKDYNLERYNLNKNNRKKFSNRPKRINSSQKKLLKVKRNIKKPLQFPKRD